MSGEFRVHWGRVGEAPLIALWPAPVNPDACFEAAGIADFGDADDEWDRAADALLARLLGELGAYGTPSLRTTPIVPPRSWRDRLLGRKEGTPGLEEQLRAPMRWDSLPDAVVDFGPAVSLRTGSGHVLFWITLPRAEADAFEGAALRRIAGAHPLIRTELAWEHLLRGPEPRRGI